MFTVHVGIQTYGRLSDRGEAEEAMGRGHGVQRPSSPIIQVAEPAPGHEWAVRWLVGRLLLDRLQAAGAEAVLPSIPALERVVTAQAGGGASIGVVFRGVRTPASPTHGCPQR